VTDAPPPAPTPGSHYQPATTVMLLIVVLFVAAAFLMLRANPPSSPTATTTVVTTTTTAHQTTTTHPPKARVRVQVANGTSTANLAHTYTQQLETLGWDTLPPVNANNKVAATVIYFNPGYRWAAQEIAASIKVKASAIKALNGLTPVSGASSDDVIVVLGPDLAIKG
jgi:hypothetical protein